METKEDAAVADELKDEENKENKKENALKSTSTESIIKSALPINPDPTFSAYLTNFDITKISNNKLNAMVAHRSNMKTKFVKCGFCGKYDRLGAYNCSRCNASLISDTMKNSLLNDNENNENNENKDDQKIDCFLECCDKCMSNFVYGCIYLSIFAVLFIFPLFETINISQHWNNYGGCSVNFQYLILSKLLITVFLYSLIGMHVKFKKVKSMINKPFILCIGMILFFVWLIVASIVFWGDDNFDHSHCNAHDEHTSGYYDFMYIEIMLVYAIFGFIISYFTWITISKHDKLIKCVVYGNACITLICLPTAIPICEIIMLVIFWDNHGHCSDKFEWYILVKVVFILCLFSVSGALFFYFKKYKNDKIRSIVINIIIGILYTFLCVWGMMAAQMFFDKKAYDHHQCNHESMHTAIYYDWMFVEIILNFAMLHLGGNVILCLIFAGYLCGKSKQNVSETKTEIELQSV